MSLIVTHHCVFISGFLPVVDAAQLGDKETCKGQLSSVSANYRGDAITGKYDTSGNLSHVMCAKLYTFFLSDLFQILNQLGLSTMFILLLQNAISMNDDYFLL